MIHLIFVKSRANLQESEHYCIMCQICYKGFERKIKKESTMKKSSEVLLDNSRKRNDVL